MTSEKNEKKKDEKNVHNGVYFFPLTRTDQAKVLSKTPCLVVPRYSSSLRLLLRTLSKKKKPPRKEGKKKMISQLSIERNKVPTEGRKEGRKERRERERRVRAQKTPLAEYVPAHL